MKRQYILPILLVSFFAAGCSKNDPMDTKTKESLELMHKAAHAEGGIAKPEPEAIDKLEQYAKDSKKK